MNNEPEMIRCEDCTERVHVSRSILVVGDLVCEACAEHRASAPAIFTPMWTRVWQVLAGKPQQASRR